MAATRAVIAGADSRSMRAAFMLVMSHLRRVAGDSSTRAEPHESQIRMAAATRFPKITPAVFLCFAPKELDCHGARTSQYRGERRVPPVDQPSTGSVSTS